MPLYAAYYMQIYGNFNKIVTNFNFNKIVCKLLRHEQNEFQNSMNIRMQIGNGLSTLPDIIGRRCVICVARSRLSSWSLPHAVMSTQFMANFHNGSTHSCLFSIYSDFRVWTNSEGKTLCKISKNFPYDFVRNFKTLIWMYNITGIVSTANCLECSKCLNKLCETRKRRAELGTGADDEGKCCRGTDTDKKTSQ